jgi:hypothetical protein
MVQELGETRDALALATWNKAIKIANDHQKEKKPFYIVYAAKPDPGLSGAVVNGLVASGGIRETFKLCHHRPQCYLGQLVWFVNHATGDFLFIPELSPPPDVPLDPSLLSDKSEDKFAGVMQQGKDLKILVS